MRPNPKLHKKQRHPTRFLASRLVSEPVLLLFLFPHPHDQVVPLLPQGNPDPEPAYHLQEEESEEDAVLQHITTPGARDVVRVVARWVG